MRCSTKLKPCVNLIDLTPLVNVIFLLLIFFLVTSETLPLKSLLIQHPQLNLHEEALLSQLVVVVDKDQVVYVGSKKEIVDLPSLPDAIQRHLAVWKQNHQGLSPTVTLSIDKRVDYETFLRLFSEVIKVTPKVRLAFRTDAPKDIEEL
jgi:biopolymer transport protein ExbD